MYLGEGGVLDRDALALDFRIEHNINTVSNEKKPEKEKGVAVTEEIPKISRYLLIATPT